MCKNDKTVKITGVIERILFQKDQFIIGHLKSSNKTVTFIGDFYGIEEKDKITIHGLWEKHSRYGWQIRVSSWERPIPSTKEQTLSFLSSGLVKGVGKKRAERIVEKLGSNAVNVIKDKGAKVLKSIRGIGEKSANDIANAIQEVFEVQDIIKELSVFKIKPNTCMKLFKEFGSETLNKVKRNPYVIMEVDRISFEKADTIALDMGLSKNSTYRMSACLIHTLNRLCNSNGHSFIDENLLIKETLKTLNANTFDENELVDREKIVDVLYSLEEQEVMFEEHKVYPINYFTYETYIAQKLSILRESRDGGAMPNVNKHIKKYQKDNGIILTEKQKETINKIVEENILILTGKPGTGKTTTLRAIIEVFKKVYNEPIIKLASPTGRASRKMEEATGKEASTVHRMIGYVQGEIPDYNESNKLEADLIILDEWSMADLRLTYWLLSALDNDTKVLFLGDVNQLPSVSAGNVLSDIIKAKLPTVELNEIFRQAETSQIILNSHRINEGKHLLIDQSKEDFYFIHQRNPVSIAQLMVMSVSRFLELGYTLDDILVLTPMRVGNVGTEILNDMLREVVNPKSPNKKEIKVGDSFYRVGDKIMQNKNNLEKDVFNGELGVIKYIRKNKEDNSEEIVCNFNGTEVVYERSELAEIELGYAITIHKSQGGEAPIVIMPITLEHRVMLARNLYYTGITRAKEKVVLIGDENAMNVAIQNNQVTLRNSLLDKRILDYQRYLLNKKSDIRSVKNEIKTS